MVYKSAASHSSPFVGGSAEFDADFQVHRAHYYLLAQVSSLMTNQRTDEYGGDLDSRSRFILEITDEFRSRVTDPKFIVCHNKQC